MRPKVSGSPIPVARSSLIGVDTLRLWRRSTSCARRSAASCKRTSLTSRLASRRTSGHPALFRCFPFTSIRCALPAHASIIAEGPPTTHRSRIHRPGRRSQRHRAEGPHRGRRHAVHDFARSRVPGTRHSRRGRVHPPVVGPRKPTPSRVYHLPRDCPHIARVYQRSVLHSGSQELFSSSWVALQV